MTDDIIDMLSYIAPETSTLNSVLRFLQKKLNTSLNLAKEISIFAVFILIFNSPVGAENSNKYHAKRIPKTSAGNEEYRTKRAFNDNENEKVEDDTPMEKDPHFLFWKIISKVFILTVLRATRRLWYPNYSIIGFIYGTYMMTTLALWLKICCDVLMEYILLEWS